ncbi:MAG: tRNA lysidine(34) synthetase TilS [Roseiflexaceae bacterium]
MRHGAAVLVAVSGGPDSLALLYWLAEQRERLGLRLHVAHLDHGLRGDESAAEARFVAEQAAQLGIAATIDHADVAGLAARYHTNEYAIGRAARYALFARVALAEQIDLVAVAHTANDQAETVLMHLLRGAGGEGLSGMRAVVSWPQWSRYAEPLAQFAESYRIDLIRPLLQVKRSTIEQFCQQRGLAPRADSSNLDQRHRRSRIRHHLIPLLESYNEHIIDLLNRTAATLAADQELIEHVLDQHWPVLVQVEATAVRFDWQVWQSLHVAIRRAAIRRAYRLLGGRETVGLADLERVCAAAERGPQRLIELPGRVAVHIRSDGIVIGAPAAAHGPQLDQDPVELVVPGQNKIGTSWVIQSVVEESAPVDLGCNPWEVWLPIEWADRLVVRRRQVGDRIKVAAGHRRIQDVMVDAKLDRSLRAAWPLLVVDGRIVWVVGLRRAADLVRPDGRAVGIRLVETGRLEE